MDDKNSLGSIDLYHESYFLNQVDGFQEFSDFNGAFSKLFPRYQRNLALLDLKPEHSYLEYGCGRGEICMYHAMTGGRAVGVDYSDDAINLAKKKSECIGVNVEFYASPFQDFAPSNDTFDRILASEFIEHISYNESRDFMRIAYKALKKGGQLLIYTHPNTLQRRFGYPLIRIYSKLIGRPLPRQQEDTLSEHYEMYHLNEQNYFSLRNLALKSDFSYVRVGYDLNFTKNERFKNIIKFVVKNTPLRHILLKDLFLVAIK